MSKIKRTILVYSNATKMGHRDLFETNFYSYLEKNYNVSWLFDDQPIKHFIKNRKNYHIVKIKQNIRFLFWTYLFYLEEIEIKKKHDPKKIYKNSRLYINKFNKKIIELIYFLKLHKLVKIILGHLLNKSFVNYDFFTGTDLFISISTGKDLLADDLARNAKKRNIPFFFIPAGWDHISGKPILVKPDKIFVWGEQTKKLCRNIHNQDSEIIGSFKFDIYNKNISRSKALNKLNLNKNYKYILICGSVVVFNEKKLINKILKYLKSKNKKNYRIIYKPHPFAMKRMFDENINFNMPNKVIMSEKIKKEFELKDYPYLLNSIEGIITPYSTMIVEALFHNIPCMTVGYTEKNQYNFDWKLHSDIAPHLKILKNKEFIINCANEKNFDRNFKSFLNLIDNRKKYISDMKYLTNKVVFRSKGTFNDRIKNVVDKYLTK